MLRYICIACLVKLNPLARDEPWRIGFNAYPGQCKQNSHSATDNSSADKNFPTLWEAESSFPY